MSVVKRFNPLKNLDELDVLIDDVNTSSHIVITDMPQSLPQGKSSFLIETGPYMREGIELVFDFIDSEGNSIYLEPVSDYLEGTSRRVSVEVYSDTAPGPANIIVVGELDEIPTAPGLFAETDPVPEEFQGVYNIRLTREVIINPVAVNTQPIRFYTQPRVSINERRLGTMERTDPPDLITTNPFAVEGVPADGFGFKEFSTEEPKQGALAETNTKIVQSKGKTGKFSRMKKSFKAKKGKRKFSFFKRAGHIAKRNSPEAFPFSFKTSAHSFNTKEIDGKIILTSIDTTKYNQSQFNELKLTFPPTLNNTHTMSIEDVGNSATAFVTKPFTQTNADGQEIILPFFGNAKTRFEPPPTASYSTVNVMSYADVSITNMRTFSGDVFKAKVYVRPEGSFDDFKVLAELPVEASDLMVDLQSVGRGERTGYFENQADITKYWEKFGGTNGLSGGSTVASNFNNDILLDAVKLSGSLATFTDQMRFQQKSDYKFNLKAGLDYNLTFTAYAKKGTNKRALLIPYVSGSGMYASPDEYSDSVTENKVKENSSYGKRLGSLEILPADDNEVNFKVVTTEFSPNRDGDGLVQFRVVDGEWYINDISVSPATDTGFSPSFFQFEKEMPSEYQHKRPEKFEFMVEFYDPNNNIADSIAFNSGSVFNGANAFMSGNDNTMAGSLFIGGESTASGMHFGGVSSVIPETGGDGATGSGFMRSVGYQGFISASNPALAGTFGFMIYSGSVLPDSGDNYAGVGLELVGQSGSLKFRTNPSVFEVQADAFFVGKTTTQFISGSGGNIEISSSGLHITPEGNVTASAILLGDKANSQFLQFDDGQLTVQGNLSVDQIFTPALINGAASNVTNASSSITSQGFAKFTSASIAGFDVNTQAIVSSGSNLVMSQSGQITGSTVLFTGGKIGSFNLSNDAFTAGNTFFISSSVTNSQGFFISSSNFNIKAGGDVTGSNVNFVGGTIGGWSLGDSTITGGNLILNKAGSIRSSDYITDTSGFIISSEENGFAEFENVKIRGTLATTTFEKESVNAVGGQLFIANSAAMTGSSVPATGSKFRLKNVTGFTKGEILLIKKVGDTGFNTEYVKVVSASRTNDGGDDDPDGLAGDLFVERGTGYYVRAKKEYLADNDSNGTIRTYSATLPLKYATNVQNYDSGDANGFNVTGGHSHSGSFHIYVTGSVGPVGDGTALDLRVLNNSNSDSVIGTTRLWSLSDGVTQVDREIFHFHNTLTPIPTGSKIKMELVATTDGTDDSFLYLSKFTASLDWGTIGSPTLYGDASGSVGDPIGGPENYTEGQVLVSTGRYISGTGTNTVGTGYIRLNANPKNKATPYMDIVERTGSGIYDIELKARVGDLSGVAGTRNVPADFTGFGIMSEVAFLSGSQIKLEAPTFLLGDKNANFVSGSSGNIEISSSKFHVKPDGDIVVRKVDATEGSLGGFSIANNAISSSDGNININANTKAISINDTTFGNTGIQLEYNSGTPRTFIGKSTGANFNFDGTNLSVSASNFKVTSTGEVTASSALFSSGKFTGNLTSDATITGGTLQTAARTNSTTATGNAVVIDGSDNALMFYTNIFEPVRARMSPDPTAIYKRTLRLDDSVTATAELTSFNLPGIFFDGYQFGETYALSQSRDITGTYDGHSYVGYIPYAFKRGATDLETAITGRMINVNRAQLGSIAEGVQHDGTAAGNEWGWNSGHGGGAESDDYASISSYVSNGAEPNYEGPFGNPGGSHGGVSGSGSDRFVQNFKVLNVYSKPSIAYTLRGTSTQRKESSAFSADVQYTIPGAIEGYNYLSHYQPFGLSTLIRSPEQINAMNSPTHIERYANTTLYPGDNNYVNLTSADGGNAASAAGYNSAIDNNGSDATPSNIRRIFYRLTGTTSGQTPSMGDGSLYFSIRIQQLNNSDGPNDGNWETVLELPQVYYDDSLSNGGSFDSGHVLISETDYRMNCWMIPNGEYSSNSTSYTRFQVKGDQQDGFGTGVGDTWTFSTATYIRIVGDRDTNVRLEDFTSYGNRHQNYLSGSQMVKYGTNNRLIHGDTAYGVYSQVNTAKNGYAIYGIADAGSYHNRAGVTGYAGYFDGKIHVTGDITYGGSISDTSDERLKTDLRDVSGSLEKLQSLKVKRFKWRDDTGYDIGDREGTQDIGLIAQEVQEVLPELIMSASLHKKGTHQDDTTPIEKDDFLFMNYAKITPFLIEAIQEQQKQIEELKTEIEVLKDEN